MLIMEFVLLSFFSVDIGVDASTTGVKVMSTAKISKTITHGRKGNVYSDAKLTKRYYQMKKYKHTTWYATKRATIKKDGKLSSLTYIKSGKRKGWIYSKYLIAGKAPKRVSRAAKILSTNNPKKYEAAYKKFTAKGIVLTARGGVPINKNAYRCAGLTLKEYKVFLWGIYDYYQNAINHGWITKKQGWKAEDIAHNKVLKGKYAKHPIKQWERKYDYQY